MKTKIFLWNPAQVNAQYSDLGDIAMFHVMLNGLKDCDVVEYTSDEKYTKKKYNVITIPFGFKGLLKTLKEVYSSDLVIVGGGDVIQDKSSILILPFNLSRTILALILRIPVMASGMGVDDKKEISWFGRKLSRIVLNRYKLITVRDPESKGVLRELGINRPKIIVTADTALGLKQASEKSVEEIFEEEGIKEKNLVGIFIRSTFHRTNSLIPFAIQKKLGLLSGKYKIEVKNFCDNVANTLDYLIEKYKVGIIFMYAFPKGSVSTYDDEMTQNISNLIKNKDKIKIIRNVYEPEEIKAIVAKTRFLISIPLHAIIIGSSAGVPVLDINYAAKVKRYMKLIGQENCVVEIRELAQKDNSHLLKKKIDYIMQNRSEIKKTIEKNIEDLRKQGLKNPEFALNLAIEGEILD